MHSTTIIPQAVPSRPQSSVLCSSQSVNTYALCSLNEWTINLVYDNALVNQIPSIPVRGL